jgi:hypothetical protein
MVDGYFSGIYGLCAMVASISIGFFLNTNHVFTSVFVIKTLGCILLLPPSQFTGLARIPRLSI